MHCQDFEMLSQNSAEASVARLYGDDDAFNGDNEGCRKMMLSKYYHR